MLVDAGFNRKVLEQIRKDFVQLELEIDIENPEVIPQMQFHLEKLLESGMEKLMNLLYRIDISEKKIVALSDEDPHMPYRDVLTFLIIQREAQKVMFRELYKPE
ncbi:MAG: hypothetical protein C0599_01450 [Salinivirgaceae bacterium]|nr:MAG: hypothetical protein C0599_01450 [Salinivirgaceae bacterium]